MNITDFETYQRQSRKTWSVIHVDHSIVYPTLGLTNEAGEVAGKIKKIFRDKGGVISEEDRQSLKKELGDVVVKKAAAVKSSGWPNSFDE